MVLRRPGRGIAIMVLSMLLMSGCAQDAASAPSTPQRLPAAGPWAQEFGESLALASDYETQILRDGEISAAELADAQARDRACMRDAGYDLQVADDGTSSLSRIDGADLPEMDVVEAVRRRCSHQFDRSITYLFNEVRRNPEKQDEAKITVACLQKSGLVGKDYTERKWRSENDTGMFSFDDYDPAAAQCRLDPLSLWRQG
ncbi:hypothetical protein DEI89_10780 [Curtobacterium sp. MCBD17_030]|nr:hypothetical protein DEI89_10780 [Curtobacterium sp. MCBD17_030]